MVEGRFTFIVAFAVGVLFSPIGVDAQQREKIPKVGYLSNNSSEAPGDTAFMQDLRDLGRVNGRTIVIEARYAVRNNQRSFLKVMMPPGSTVWSAKVGGRPIRPGVAERDAVLLPLEKGRAGEDAPTFVVELVYLQRIENWSDKGQARLNLPALDLPVSRTGVELHWHVALDGDELARKPGAIRLGKESFPSPLRGHLPRTGKERLQVAELGQQLLRAFLANPLHTGNVVRCVTDERQKVDHLSGGYAQPIGGVAFVDPGLVYAGRAASPRVQQGHAGTDELIEKSYHRTPITT